MIEVDLTGVWRTVKATAPALISQRGGSIIFTASTNALEAGPNNAHYTVSKRGVVGLMRSAAVETGHFGVRSNAVLPGPVMTQMINNENARARFAGERDSTTERLAEVTENWTALKPFGALAPSHIADAMIWLASDESVAVSGALLPVDAGHAVLPGLSCGPPTRP